ncbi:MAG TPA: enoyl-CoA hydratase/isomerase family protein [Streptosporangiaceae bacterium]|jgi:enoyl-CoA hydratase|nr:enoyl-CoA hydratase/isomerase family protein [Streptosporangiaceae bacterium]
MEQQGPATPPLVVADHEPVQRWTMQLAPVNAVNGAMLDGFEAALDAAVADSRVAAVVLDSGLKVFSAGADATWMARTAQDLGPQGLLEDFNATMDRFRMVCLRLREAPFLVIAALDGHALAGGLELAAACDLRFCADTEGLRLGVPEMDLFGCLPSGGGGAQFLARILGPSRALDFILNAKPVSPARALQMGLVDRLYPAGEVSAQAVEFAREVAGKAGRTGVTCAKRAIFVAGELPLRSAMELDGALHWDTMRRGNFLPGVEAFTKRYASGAAR